jgi:ankyrin repeat protein
VELGADLNGRTGSGRTPLCLAVEKEKADARAALEALIAPVDLLTAIALGDAARVEATLAAGVTEAERNTALISAVKYGPVPLVERLLALGAPVDHATHFDWMRGITPLAVAAFVGNQEAAARLLAAGADPNHVDEYPGATALHYAAWNGQTELAGLLLDRGAGLETKDAMYDADPLGWATENHQSAMIDFLLERGATADISRIAYFGRLEQVRQMLDEDPMQINFVGNYGTALHQAALHGHTEIVRLLLERGADLQILNRHGDPVLTMVRKARQGLAHPSNLPAHAEIEELLVASGARE